MRFTGWKRILKRFWGKGTCPYQLSFVLDSPFRRLVLSPRKLADRLNLNRDSRVLEIGPGSGYFSVEVARRLPQGRLELFDLQREMLAKARRKIAAAGLPHVGFIQGDATRLPFAGNTFDRVFLVAVLGEVSNPPECLKEIYRVLRPFGLLSLTEQPGDPDFVPLEQVRFLAEKQGFQWVETFGRKRNFTANFRKPGYLPGGAGSAPTGQAMIETESIFFLFRGGPVKTAVCVSGGNGSGRGRRVRW